MIAFEGDRYRIPASYANQPVSLRVYADRLVVVAQGHVIAQHPRHINRRDDRGATFYDWRHYLAVLHASLSLKMSAGLLGREDGGEGGHR